MNTVIFAALLTTLVVPYANAQVGSNILGVGSQRPTWEALAAMLGFASNNRRDSLEKLIDESTTLNQDTEHLIDRIVFLLKPVREVDATTSENRLDLAKKTAVQHAYSAQDISDRADRGVQTMQEVSDFLVNTAQFLNTLSKKSKSPKLKSLMEDVTKAHNEIDKLMAITVTYALKANQAAYDATAAAEKVRGATVLRVAIDNVMDAEAASSQAGEVAQAIMVNEQIAQATGEKYVNFFSNALASIETLDSPTSDVRNVLGQLLGQSSGPSNAASDTEQLQMNLNNAVSRLRTLRTSARIYLEATTSAAKDTKTLMDMLNSLKDANQKLGSIPAARAASLEAAKNAAKQAEADYNSVTIAVAIAEKVAERATDIPSMRSAYETAQKKITDVEKLVEKLRQANELSIKKKEDIFGSIKTTIPSAKKSS